MSRTHVAGSLFVVIVALFLSTERSLWSSDVVVAWDMPLQNTDGSTLTDLAGCKLSWGKATGAYDHTVDVGNTTTSLVSGLDEGATYYATAKAYNGAGRESAYSPELVFTVPDQTAPVITAPAARTLEAGVGGKASVPDFLTGLVVTDNLTPRAQLTVTQTPAAGSLVGVGTTAVIIRATDAAGNASQVTVNVTVKALLIPGSPRNLRVVPR